jgi:hypothetical protein
MEIEALKTLYRTQNYDPVREAIGFAEYHGVTIQCTLWSKLSYAMHTYSTIGSVQIHSFIHPSLSDSEGFRFGRSFPPFGIRDARRCFMALVQGFLPRERGYYMYECHGEVDMNRDKGRGLTN